MYLGISIPYNLSFGKTAKLFTNKAQAACSKVHEIIKRSGVPPIITHIKLFNAIARATLVYAAPLWALSHRRTGKSTESILYKITSSPKICPRLFCAKRMWNYKCPSASTERYHGLHNKDTRQRRLITSKAVLPSTNPLV